MRGRRTCLQLGADFLRAKLLVSSHLGKIISFISKDPRPVSMVFVSNGHEKGSSDFRNSWYSSVGRGLTSSCWHYSRGKDLWTAVAHSTKGIIFELYCFCVCFNWIELCPERPGKTFWQMCYHFPNSVDSLLTLEQVTSVAPWAKENPLKKCHQCNHGEVKGLCWENLISVIHRRHQQALV